MAHVVLADDGVEFDGRTPRVAALGGAEAAVVSVCEALAARGHRVDVYTRKASVAQWEGVNWHTLSDGLPVQADLYIANRGSRLIGAVPKARQVFWTHNPCRFMKKPRYLWPLWRVKPMIVFLGEYHASTYPAWAPDGGRMIISYGVDRMFWRETPASSPPPPKAIWTSNPMRGLDRLLAQWEGTIHPQVPEAELHVFFPPPAYRGKVQAKAAAMEEVLNRAHAMRSQGVVVRSPVPRADLVAEFLSSRVMLYWGDENETFCMAVAEAQAMGLPAVVSRAGSLPERVVHKETGIVADDGKAYAEGAVLCLGDDDAWRRCHLGALRSERRLDWAEAARRFESLMG